MNEKYINAYRHWLMQRNCSAKRTRMEICLDKEIRASLEAIARRTGLSMSDIINKALELYIKAMENKTLGIAMAASEGSIDKLARIILELASS